MSNEELLARINRLEARVHTAESHAAILDLKSRYGALMDARYTREGPKTESELDALAEQLCDLFTPEAIWEAGGELGTVQGRAALFERFRRPSLLYSWHFFVKPEIEVQGETARGCWDVLAMMTTTAGRAMWMVGVEHDEYAYVDGRWLHTRMRLDSKLMAPYDRGWGPKASQG
ncbi:MAG: nuclear transport factor 2 family protein [Myxococcota bacterium]